LRANLILQIIHEIGKIEGTTPLITGGTPRDKLLGRASQINDFDITTGHNTQYLAKEVAIKLRKYVPISTKEALDGHSSIYIGKGNNIIKIDFSSNFKIPNIEKILYRKGITSPTEMQKEVYSRDFNCNTLLMTLDFKKVKDLTHQAIPDIKNKIIRTCLTPDLTFKYNTNRIIRAIYLAAKLDFDVSPDIIEWIRANPNYLLQSEISYNTKNINKALSYDPDKTIYLIDKMNLWNFLPITDKLAPLYSRRLVAPYGK